MGYISRLDTKFITYVNRKYCKYNVKFSYFDDYILWLYYDLLNSNESNYYSQLEKDIMEYSNMQTGSPRKNLTLEQLIGAIHDDKE